MDSVSWAQWATYISYLFVIVAYCVKIVKYFRMPLHLRWELYPVPHEKNSQYGGSYMEEPEWWTKPRSRKRRRNLVDMLKRYFLFNEYFRKTLGYWFGLYPWHIGFYLIVCFHALAFLGALIIFTTGISIASASPNVIGVILYYLTIVVAGVSFILGTIGSIGLLIKRLIDRALRSYASPVNYFNYLFFLVVFVSGLVSWLFFDLSLSVYRTFWVGLITFEHAEVEAATYAHIILFSLFLIYLPFTRSTHYITKILAFFSIRWDDKPNLKGSKVEGEVKKLLNQPVSWSAAHIQTGSTWGEIAKGLPEDSDGKES